MHMTSTPVPTLPVEIIQNGNSETFTVAVVGLAATFLAALIPVLINLWTEKRRWLRQERVGSYKKLALSLHSYIAKLKEVKERRNRLTRGPAKEASLLKSETLGPSLNAYNEFVEACLECQVNGSEAIRALVTTTSQEASKAYTDIYDEPNTQHLQTLKQLENAIARVMRADIGSGPIFTAYGRRRAVDAFRKESNSE